MGIYVCVYYNNICMFFGRYIYIYIIIIIYIIYIYILLYIIIYILSYYIFMLSKVFCQAMYKRTQTEELFQVKLSNDN